MDTGFYHSGSLLNKNSSVLLLLSAAIGALIGACCAVLRHSGFSSAFCAAIPSLFVSHSVFQLLPLIAAFPCLLYLAAICRSRLAFFLLVFLRSFSAAYFLTLCSADLQLFLCGLLELLFPCFLPLLFYLFFTDRLWSDDRQDGGMTVILWTIPVILLAAAGHCYLAEHWILMLQ